MTIRLRSPAPLAEARPLTETVDGYFNAAFLPAAAGERRLKLICRTAYYDLDARGFMVGEAGPGLARNALLELDLRGTGRRPVDIAPAPEFDALEDLRFFESTSGVLFFAVGYEDDESGHRPVPVVGRLRRAAQGLAITRRTATEQVRGVEKNWVYFERAGRVFLEKYPGMSEVYEVDPDTLALRYARVGSRRFSWSGTKAAPFDAGVLFLDHRRIYILRGMKTVQRYVFRFRHISDDGGKTRCSRVFSLGPASTMVYVSDMHLCQSQEEVLIAASENDSAFRIYGLKVDAVRALLASGSAQ